MTDETEDRLYKEMMDKRFDFCGAVVAAHASWANFPEGAEVVDELFEKANELEEIYMDAYNTFWHYVISDHDQLEIAEIQGNA